MTTATEYDMDVFGAIEMQFKVVATLGLNDMESAELFATLYDQLIERARNEGYRAGVDKGHLDGFQLGLDTAQEQEYANGFKEGTEAGHREGTAYGQFYAYRKVAALLTTTNDKNLKARLLGVLGDMEREIVPLDQIDVEALKEAFSPAMIDLVTGAITEAASPKRKPPRSISKGAKSGKHVRIVPEGEGHPGA